MQLTNRKTAAAIFLAMMLVACVSGPEIRTATEKPDVLIVHENGAMEFREHRVSQDDVVIYPDGFGGERAAIKIHSLVPIHPPFYRDSIAVERLSPAPANGN